MADTDVALTPATVLVPVTFGCRQSTVAGNVKVGAGLLGGGVLDVVSIGCGGDEVRADHVVGAKWCHWRLSWGC